MEAKEAWQVPCLRTTALPNNERLLWTKFGATALYAQSFYVLNPIINYHQPPVVDGLCRSFPVIGYVWCVCTSGLLLKSLSCACLLVTSPRPPLRRRSRPCDWTWEICRPETPKANFTWNFTIQWLELKSYECRYSEVLRVSRAHDSCFSLTVSNRQNAYFFWQKCKIGRIMGPI